MAQKPSTAPVYLKVDWDPADASAIQALQRGEATHEQQKRALNWIIMNAGANDDLPWVPDNERHSSFFAGRQFVARQIVKLLKLNVSAFLKSNK